MITSNEIWRAGSREQRWETLSSGFPMLDRCLPGGGWPLAAMTEVFIGEYGIGELQLFMPALARRARHGITWIAPPFMPYAPALVRHGLDLRNVLLVQPSNAADVPWAIEQVLQTRAESTVLAWLTHAGQTTLRRLQLSIAAQRIWAVFFSPLHEVSRRSPAALKLCLSVQNDALHVNILKCRGGRPASVHIAGHEVGG
ncbi:MAG: translesion DNA synthesis-associated protein ImuA [Gammaproteobacteria bacterium]